MKKDRELNVFSLSFLDVMSCGLGAVVLLVMIIHGKIIEKREESLESLIETVNVLRSQRNDLQDSITQLKTQQNDLSSRIEHVVLQKESLQNSLNAINQEAVSQPNIVATNFAELVATLNVLNRKLAAAGASVQIQNVFKVDKRSKYITGLDLSKKRILFLVDRSASMLDSKLSNILITRNLSDDKKRNTKKWKQVIETVSWLVERIPSENYYRVHFFSEQTTELPVEKKNQWIAGGDIQTRTKLLQALAQILPEGGTNLSDAFSKIKHLSPPPDSIILLTDGLPTFSSGISFQKNISAVTRSKYFHQAVEKLPRNIPVNTILFPLEGDPAAASSYWSLALKTKGTFFIPSSDWP